MERDIVERLTDYSYGRDVTPLTKTALEAGLTIMRLRDEIHRLENIKRELANMVTELEISRSRWRKIAEHKLLEDTHDKK